jgi:hypothetical protein
MNTNKSEEILNKITDEFFKNIIKELEKLSEYDKMDEITQSYLSIHLIKYLNIIFLISFS